MKKRITHIKNCLDEIRNEELTKQLNNLKVDQKEVIQAFAIGGPSYIVKASFFEGNVRELDQYLCHERIPEFARHLEIVLANGIIIKINLEYAPRYQSSRRIEISDEFPEHTFKLKNRS